MNLPTIFAIERLRASSLYSDNAPTPAQNPQFLALPWSREVHTALAVGRHSAWCCVWLPLCAAEEKTLAEFALLGMPVTLTLEENAASAEMRSALALMAGYPNICGAVCQPFDEEECTKQREKMRNVAMAKMWWNALELKLVPEDPSPTGSLPIPLDNILYAEAQNQYVDIYDQQATKHLLPETLGSIVQRLETQTPFGKTPPLVRIHDKYAVNPAQVLEVRPSESRRDYLVRLSNGKELNMSRTYKHHLAKLPVKVQRLRGGGVKNLAETANKSLHFLVSDVLLNVSDVLLNSA